MKAIVLWLVLLFSFSIPAAEWVTYEGKTGAGRGKHIVLLSGDEEYRSEEALPMLGKILAVHHGFKCTVLFPINPKDGTINPNESSNIPGIEHLKTADLAIMFWRFRELPDDKMKIFVDYMESGKPLIGIRTSTHAFDYKKNKESAYKKYHWGSKEWPGGFGQQVLGDTWISHHGDHGKESTRGIINEQLKNHPILKGVQDIWGPTDVYGIRNLPKDAQVLVFGQILEGMKPTDKPVVGKKNEPMMPLIWVREHKHENGKASRILTSTIGSSVDFQSEDLRRLFVNACYWGMSMESKIPERSKVDYIGNFEPTFFGFNKFKTGVRPEEHELKSR